MAAGFLRPDAGQTIWRGRRITGPDPARGFVFQKPQLYPWLDVLGNVMFGPRAMGRSRDSRPFAQQLLVEMGLEGFERHRPYELSGGMQHRVALARTLVNDPDLLLMDEPFAALDAQTREEMQALLLEIWERHQRTVLFVTHDIEEGLLLADRVVILSHRPSTVREIIDVPFGRPRSYGVIHEQRFVDLRRRTRSLLARRIKA
jgi:NitT/TauT family transport system ATP-binding protein